MNGCELDQGLAIISKKNNVLDATVPSQRTNPIVFNPFATVDTYITVVVVPKKHCFQAFLVVRKRMPEIFPWYLHLERCS